MDAVAIHNQALAEAQKAADARIQEWKDSRGAVPFYCGFAWAVIKPARGKFVKDLKAAGIADNGVYGGVEIRVPVLEDGQHTQSMDLKEVAVLKYCEVLKSHGIPAMMRSRAD